MVCVIGKFPNTTMKMVSPSNVESGHIIKILYSVYIHVEEVTCHVVLPHNTCGFMEVGGVGEGWGDVAVRRPD